MKKKLLPLLMFGVFGATSAMAYEINAMHMYASLETGYGFNKDKQINNDDDDITKTNDAYDIGLKVGYGADGGWKAEGKFSYIKFEDDIYNNRFSKYPLLMQDTNSDDFFEVSIVAIREFRIPVKNLYPFVRLGGGYGLMKVDNLEDDYVGEVSFHSGAGISFRATNHFSIAGGFDYIHRRWSREHNLEGGYSLKIRQNTFRPYIAFNYDF